MHKACLQGPRSASFPHLFPFQLLYCFHPLLCSLCSSSLKSFWFWITWISTCISVPLYVARIKSCFKKNTSRNHTRCACNKMKQGTVEFSMVTHFFFFFLFIYAKKILHLTSKHCLSLVQCLFRIFKVWASFGIQTTLPVGLQPPLLGCTNWLFGPEEGL